MTKKITNGQRLQRRLRRVGTSVLLVLSHAAVLQTGCFTDSPILEILDDPALPEAIGEIATAYFVESLM